MVLMTHELRQTMQHLPHPSSDTSSDRGKKSYKPTPGLAEKSSGGWGRVRIHQLEGQLEAERERREKAEVEQQESGWRGQLSEARQRTEAAEARAEQAGSEIAGWQVAGEFAKAKVSEAKEAAKTAREEAVKMVAAAKETGQVAKQEAAASYS